MNIPSVNANLPNLISLYITLSQLILFLSYLNTWRTLALTCNGMVVRAALQSRKHCLVNQTLQVIQGLLACLCINTMNSWNSRVYHNSAVNGLDLVWQLNSHWTHPSWRKWLLPCSPSRSCGWWWKQCHSIQTEMERLLLRPDHWCEPCLPEDTLHSHLQSSSGNCSPGYGNNSWCLNNGTQKC